MLTIAAILMFCETELGVAFMDATYVRPQVVAHRGSTKFAPENTMAALEKAISTGIDMVEIDVHQLKDGHLILLHDNSFGHTTGHPYKQFGLLPSACQDWGCAASCAQAHHATS